MAERFTDLARRASQLQKPGEGLVAVAALRRQLEALEASHVDSALKAGWPWSRIAASLGVSKQAAHKKHAHRLRSKPAASPVSDGERAKLVVTGEARRSVRLAREEAVALGQGYVGVEHLLLGLLRDTEGAATETLASVGVTLEAAREQVVRLLAEQAGTEVARLEPSAEARSAAARLPVSTRAREAMEQSLREAVRLESAHLGPEHILLALLRSQAGVVARIFAGLGLSPVVVEQRLDVVLAEEGAAAA
jgi:hypothetical protein